MFRFLASFYYHRNTDLAAIVDAAGGHAEICADSGAFSAYTTGGTVRLADYAAWLHHWAPLITTAINLDVIGDPAASAANLTKLEEQRLAVLPVFHGASPLPVLEKLCAEYGYIGLGGLTGSSVGTRTLMTWLIRCFRTAEATGTRFHGLGQTSQTLLASLPYYSIDSSAWTRAVRYGQIALWDGRAARLRQVGYRHADAYRYARLCRAHGVDPARIAQPGFAQLKKRGRDAYTADLAMAIGASAVAWHRFGAWLSARRHVPPPTRLEPAGARVVPGRSPGP